MRMPPNLTIAGSTAMHVKKQNLDLLKAELPRLNALLNEGKIDLLLEESRRLLTVDEKDVNICQTVARFLIDGGSVTLDSKALTDGINILEAVLAEASILDEGDLLSFRYNISNGHAALYHLHRKHNETDLAEASLQAQKTHLQGILLRRERIPAELLPAVLANYANTLDHLSRTFEAIDQFFDCLQVEPSHGVAMGNCGETIRRVLHWSEQHQSGNLLARWDLLSTAVANPEGIMKWAGPPALAYYRSRVVVLRDEVAKLFKDGPASLEEFRRHRQDEHSDPQPAPWLEAILHDRLLLTFNLRPLSSEYEAVDDAFFDSLSYGMSEEDERRSIELINILNGIKEEFVSARYLYYHANDEQARLARWNSVTHYGDPEGAAEFGLISGLLKASFRLAIDLLDKIASFLVTYFRLGDPKQGYNFNNFWYRGRDVKKGELHPVIAEKLQYNYPLIGLHDFQKDFFRQEFPGPVKDARNAAVHRWLTLYWIPIEKAKDESTSWNLDDFSSLTLFVLRQAKSAILLLISIVNVEESRAADDDSKNKITKLQQPLSVRPPVSARAAEDLEGDYDDYMKDPEGEDL